MNPEQKPFACKMEGCGMSFTNDDHLNVHRKKHDMILNLGQAGNSKISAFVADQTPTPTRLIRNCDEVGLFDDLQHVNPFEETFRRAVESKSETSTTDTHASGRNNLLTPTNHLGPIHNNEDTLHTPQLPYFSVISSDESDSKKEFTDSSATENSGSVKTIQANNAVSVISEPIGRISSENFISTHEHIQKTTVNNVKNIIIVPQIAVLQTAPISEAPTKKFKPILPNPVQTQPQIVQIFNTIEEQRPRTKPLKKLYPKIEVTQPPETNPVKEKLKEALLKTRFHTQSVIAETASAQVSGQNTKIQVKTKRVITKATNIPLNSVLSRSSTSPSDPTAKPHDRTNSDSVFERNRAAARRYRKKLKNRQNEIKRRNNELEAENQRLKTELKALKILLLAHQDCSVSRSLALGKSIQIGLQNPTIQQPAVTPTVIVTPKTLNQKNINSTNNSNAPS